MNETELMDSIGKLDSVVNALKFTHDDQALGFARQSYSLALKMNSQEALARSLLSMGVAHMNHYHDSSFIFYSRALQLANSFSLDQIKPRVYYNMAVIYQMAFDLKMAVIYLDSSILYSGKVNNYEWLSNAYNNLGILKHSMFDTSGARVMFDSAYRTGLRHNLPRQVGVAMASLCLFEQDREKLLQTERSAIEILRKCPGCEEEVASIYVNMGAQSTDPDTALEYFQTAIQSALSGNSAEVEIAAYNNMAYSYLEKKDCKNAEKCLAEFAIPMAKKIADHAWLSTLYDSYADVHIAKNDPGQAFHSERESLKERTEADQIRATEQVRLLTVVLDTKNKELQIQKKQKEVNEKDSAIHMILLWGSVSFLILFIVISVIIWKHQKTRIRLQTEVIDSARRLIDAEENMKGRVSMELHDLTTPFYTSMLRQIENAQIKNVHIESDLKKKLSETATALRRLSHRMNNSFLGQMSMSELLDGLCEDFKNTSEIPIQCKVENYHAELTREETIHIYRIIQELLTNALKYLDFGEVTLTLTEEGGMLFILYRDTGPGFDRNSTGNQGIGIRNIFERCRLIHGDAVLEAAPGQGTRWRITIPLKRSKKDNSEYQRK